FTGEAVFLFTVMQRDDVTPVRAGKRECQFLERTELELAPTERPLDGMRFHQIDAQRMNARLSKLLERQFDWDQFQPFPDSKYSHCLPPIPVMALQPLRRAAEVCSIHIWCCSSDRSNRSEEQHT